VGCTRSKGKEVDLIKAIYWDIGGVLARTTDRQPRQELAQRLGMTYEALESLVFGSESGRLAQRGEISEPERWARLAGELDIDPAEVPVVQRVFFGGDTIDASLMAYIRDLHQRYRTGIISNAMSSARGLVLERWGMGDAFDHLTFSSEVGVMKPDPRIYQHALQGLGVQPAEAVFIDDFLRNVDGARAVGMQVIQFLDPQQTMQDLDELLKRI
jgi:putative hydrolase of the HAD superfamily